ncbi:DUF397 domain-containing protein [Nocardia flavorosea]|uniref:DUF397 domain-containing protein n=1 Tax=Nocardia flavorosea TaxID=53429 RepID=A0A846Y9Q9_9NOCA|nr:DUF397 domain-containing protein [Nocardia flavorosea]NKY55883.1 DUF397 domain-containing protein [Nocardia flavorosea]
MSADRSETRWFKSSYSGGSRDCVEVAFIEGDSVGVRDSKDRQGPALAFDPAAWDAFTASTRSGRFDRS